VYRLEEIKRAARGMWSLIVGLNITGKYFLKPNVTIHYPRQEVDNLATFRGHIELIPEDGDPLTPRCISCGTCAKACPSNCITVTKKKAPAPTPEETEQGIKPKAPKDPETFRLDFTLCSLCGQCVMSCPATPSASRRTSTSRDIRGRISLRPRRPAALAAIAKTTNKAE
jgi:NADH-quinone oxidoreductase subunit I